MIVLSLFALLRASVAEDCSVSGKSICLGRHDVCIIHHFFCYLDFIPQIENQLTRVDGICSRGNVTDDAYQSSAGFTPPNLPPALTTADTTLRSELKDNFCIIMTVNVMASNSGPLFVAYDSSNNVAGMLSITSSTISLQLYGVQATFSGDFTGRFRQLSICVHDGVAELYDECSSETTSSFIVRSNDLITRLTFGQMIGNDSNVFQVTNHSHIMLFQW